MLDEPDLQRNQLLITENTRWIDYFSYLRSASSQIIKGDLPPIRESLNRKSIEYHLPSSSETRLRFDLAAASWIFFPIYYKRNFTFFLELRMGRTLCWLQCEWNVSQTRTPTGSIKALLGWILNHTFHSYYNQRHIRSSDSSCIF